MNLRDKVVVIVGGSQGFGRALAERFIKEGSKVVIASRNQANIEKTAGEIGATGIVADVRKEEDLRNLADKVEAKYGSIDIWINNAGLFKKFPMVELLDMDKAHELFDVNFFGAVLGSRTALLHMKEGGVIINIVSTSALDATRAVGAKLYAASKWALRGYVDALRGENAEGKVKILSVYPGGMKTHLHDEAIPTDFDNFMEPDYAVDKVIDNLKLQEPEEDLIIRRPSVQ
jgi:NAD(P)-dependent dehydrogenase (short-subunit alcohol dehydrogenase family)